MIIIWYFPIYYKCFLLRSEVFCHSFKKNTQKIKNRLIKYQLQNIFNQKTLTSLLHIKVYIFRYILIVNPMRTLKILI